MLSSCDVIVVGGGTAGVIAAIQSARAGASTVLIEKNGRLGGTITNAGIHRPGHFHAWGRQVVAGIGWELTERTLRETGEPIPDFTAPDSHHFNHQLPLNTAVYAAICDEQLLESGTDILLHAMPAAVSRGDRWCVSVCTKEGLVDVVAKALIDCTGDADVVALAGFERTVPDDVQPATLVFRFAGYDTGSLDYDALDRAFAEAIGTGELLPEYGCWHADRPSLRRLLQSAGYNANHIRAPHAHTARGRTAAEIEGRRAVYKLWQFLKRLPGLDALRIDWIAAECGIRETATAVGETIITLDDYTSGRVWPDSLCYAFYPVDKHGFTTEEWQAWPLNQGVVPTVPRGALVARRSRNLLVAGRCVSSDRLSNSGLRVEVSCMAMGQAAGAMAALSARTGQTVMELPIEDIKDLLRHHGAIVPEEVNSVEGTQP